MAEDGNPKLPGGLRIFSAAVIVVLLVGAGLFFIPDMVKPRWPWPLAPFNARFLGSFYLAELVAMAALLVWNRWSPARMILVMAFVFTLVVSATSLINLGQFNFARKAPWIWFVVYAGSAVAVRPVPVECARDAAGRRGDFRRRLAALFPGRNDPARVVRARPARCAFDVQRVLAVEDRCVPRADLQRDLHHGCCRDLADLRHAPREELVALGAAQLALGLLSIVGLVVTDAAVKRVDWAFSGTWVWLALFALIGATGFVKLAGGLRRVRTAAFA